MKKIKKIKINLNGKQLSLYSGSTVYNVIKRIKAQPKKIAIELNKQIINKKNIDKIVLKNKDSLEIVHFIGGGWWKKIFLKYLQKNLNQDLL